MPGVDGVVGAGVDVGTTGGVAGGGVAGGVDGVFVGVGGGVDGGVVGGVDGVDGVVGGVDGGRVVSLGNPPGGTSQRTGCTRRPFLLTSSQDVTGKLDRDTSVFGHAPMTARAGDKPIAAPQVTAKLTPSHWKR